MDYKAAMRDIHKGNIQPIYVCYGTEKYRMDEFVQYLTQKLIDEEHRDFALSKYDLGEVPIDTVIDEAQTLPFLVPRKLIIVRDPSLFIAGGKESAKIEHRVENLIAYLNSPAEYSVIVFIAQGEKLDERKKVVKAVKEKGALISFMPLSAEELLQWVAKQAEQHACSLAPGVAELLVNYAGTHLQTLSAEINKLSLYVGQGGMIDQETVKSLVVRNTEQNIFALIEEIANLRVDRALSIMYDLLKQREEPIKILALIARQFRIMLQVKELTRQSYSQQQIASQVGLHPYVVKLAGEQARKFEGERLASILSSIAELDYEMKTGKKEKVLGLELFLLRLAV
ncbi:DNA polymerase III subunit delta [Paenibacillus selenitireducens]|uniref:DNA polymerase III subunit delta n=1 Tax=Paenibacillus selenitireducens TaxID=1324314 RepID=A0A1T2XEX0_9BACL|nr:DNA polymerase III subunit delta [Paenibacillus selenitireducens]OPA78375.1 DNA polymerase III subunit delta [Paenibacillus selenitireducens]